MGFGIFIFVSNIIIPVIMLLFGMKFKKHSPENINGIYGYRTSMSMKNKETWEFAHKYCAKLWLKSGFIMLILSVAASMTLFMFDDEIKGIIEVILVSIQTIVLIASIFPVEKALKKNFDEDGNRKN